MTENPEDKLTTNTNLEQCLCDVQAFFADNMLSCFLFFFFTFLWICGVTNFFLFFFAVMHCSVVLYVDVVIALI